MGCCCSTDWGSSKRSHSSKRGRSLQRSRSRHRRKHRRRDTSSDRDSSSNSSSSSSSSEGGSLEHCALPCPRQRDTESPYCGEHKCYWSQSPCGNPRENDVRYCSEHRCHWSQWPCDNPRVDPGFYGYNCSPHTCATRGCLASIEIGKKRCATCRENHDGQLQETQQHGTQLQRTPHNSDQLQETQQYSSQSQDLSHGNSVGIYVMGTIQAAANFSASERQVAYDVANLDREVFKGAI